MFEKCFPNFIRQVNIYRLVLANIFLQIEMLRADEDELYSDSLYQIIDKATTIIPTSVNLWHAKLQFLLHAGRDNEAAAEFDKASTKLGPKALPLWRMRLMDAQVKQDPNISSIFQAAMKSDPSIAQEIQPTYLEWLVLMKGNESLQFTSLQQQTKK